MVALSLYKKLSCEVDVFEGGYAKIYEGGVDPVSFCDGVGLICNQIGSDWINMLELAID